jgi:hypothetical protein
MIQILREFVQGHELAKNKSKGNCKRGGRSERGGAQRKAKALTQRTLSFAQRAQRECST